MKKTILSRFSALVEGVSTIGITGDISKPIDLPASWIKGNDEISNLKDNINSMLGKIKKTETKLLKQRNVFQHLLLYTPAVILTVDEQVKITMVNEAFCKLFNIREAEAIGKNLSDFIPTEEILEAQRRINESIGAVVAMERRFKVGKVDMTFETTIITISPKGFLLIGRDITKEREEQEKLYLNDRLASIGEMAAGIAHELNNPLTGIVMLSQLLLQTDFPPKLKRI